MNCMNLLNNYRKKIFRKRKNNEIENTILTENKLFENNKNTVSNSYIDINKDIIVKDVVKKENLILNYKIIRELSKGYSGYVFLCENIETDDKTVVKCCYKYSSYQREINCLKILNHKNIIRLKGIGKINQEVKNKFIKPNDPLKYHIIPIEYAENGDLYSYLQNKGSLSEKVVKNIGLQILEGLNYAFDFGISHRDIKLENILLSKDNRILIADWGLSAMNTNKRMCSTSCGTLGYMSPEMICRKKYYAEKSDIWALGVLFFSLLTDTRPYSEPLKRKDPFNDNDFSWKCDWLSAMIKKKWKLFWTSHERSTNIIFNDDCKTMFEMIFDSDMTKRISIENLLKYKWFNN
jgi:serine/threonine protein kinase